MMISELRAFKALRRQLNLRLGSASARGERLTCVPWVEAVSGSWLFEEARPIQPPQVRCARARARARRPVLARGSYRLG